MAGPRELRSLAPFELGLLLAVVVLPLPVTAPAGLILLPLATLSRWTRRRSWTEVVAWRPAVLVGGALAGGVALAIALPLYGAFDVTAVDWSLLPAASGEAGELALVLASVLVQAIALELALRGWILERVLELSPGPRTLPIAAAAMAEALVVSGPIGERIGVALFGFGLGQLYVAAGHNVLASMAARGTFAIGAVLAQALGLAAAGPG